MSGSPKKPYSNATISPSLGWDRVYLFLFFFLFFINGIVGQNSTIPIYDWESEAPLPTVNVNLLTLSVNSEDITISVATDPQGNVYTLFFGKGIAKRNAAGVLINANFIPASRFNSPLDMAIDENGFIYVADYFAGGETFTDNGKIWVFSPDGVLLSSKTIYTSFYRPLGVDVDDEKVYVAEFNDGNSGPERNQLSRIGIYDKNLVLPPRYILDVNTPYRIAVDSKKWIYVSQAGNNSPSVRYYDQNFVFQNTLSNILSPGSIVIDPFDFIHVIEYDGRINFSQFINFENLNFSQVQALAKSIDDGQKAGAFSIKIFDAARVIRKTFKDQIIFPVDLTFNQCDKMYVNNAEIFGGPSIIGYLPSKLEFDLEIYKRTPSFDLSKPLLTCPANITVTAESGATSAVVTYTPPTPTDNCSFPELTREGPAPGSSFPLGTTTITYTATDEAGNSVSCSFTITVNPATEVDDAVFENCPPDDITGNTDLGQCFTIVTFPTPTASDSNGIVAVVQTKGPKSGEEFPVGNTEVIFEATGSNGNTVRCSFNVIVVDHEFPAIDCPEDIVIQVEEGRNYATVTFSNATATDNCSATVTQTGGSPSGSQFPVGEHIIEFTATDETGNSVSCSFTITVNPATEVDDAVFENCAPDDITGNTDQGQCFAIVTFSMPTASDSNGIVTVIQTKGPKSGEEFPVGDTEVVFEATGSNGNTVRCSFNVTIKDIVNPTITCTGDQIENYDPTLGFPVPDYTNFAGVTDNCEVAGVVQTPVPGTIIFDDTSIILEVTDTSGNSAKCDFMLRLTEEEVLEISCLEDVTEEISDSCNFIIPDYKNRANVNFDGAIITQTPAEGSVITSTTTIILTANLNGETDSCSFQLFLKDTQLPTLTCPREQIETFDPAVGFNVPDYRTIANPSDNCSFEWLQVPAAGTIIYESRLIEISATDLAGNQAWCNFSLQLEAIEPLELTCPENQIADYINNCSFTIPDYTGLAQVSDNNASITQFPEIGTVVFENTTITLTATLDGKTDDCSFELLLEDTTNPTITCPEDQIENYDLAVGFPVPDYTGFADVSDNCEVAGVTQTPPPGTILFEDTSIILEVTDTSGNSAKCDFMLRLTEDVVLEITCIEDQTILLTESCSFTLPDYTQDAEVNFEGATIVQSPAAGTIITSNTIVRLTASFEDETDDCVFQVLLDDIVAPEISCIENGTEFVLTNGSLTLSPSDFDTGTTDNCSFTLSLSQTTFTAIGSYSVTMRATDDNGNYSECTKTINIVEATSSDFSCLTSDIVLLLDDSGNAILKPEDAFTGNPGNTTFTLSKSSFNCADIGTQPVTLFYDGDNTGSCEVRVVVKDESTPTVRTKNITVFLNQQGVVNLTPDLINDGSSDNCSGITYSIDKTILGCKDRGQTTVTLTVTDASGNSATGTAIVTLTGFCEEEPEEPVEFEEFIYIYPNPTTGPVNFYVPKSKKIERVELFDSRDRFIMQKVFPDGTLHYNIDLTGLQSSVYIFHIRTESGTRIIRVIVK